MFSPGVFMVIERLRVATCCCASVARTVKVEVPAVVGDPLMIPVDGFKESPPGNVPCDSDQLIEGVPPLVVSGAL